MPIRDDAELAAAANRASDLIQQIQTYLGDRNCEEGRVRFPYGFIRRAAHFRARTAFLNDATLQSNIAYTLILADVLRWVSNRTHLTGTAKEMVAKQTICSNRSVHLKFRAWQDDAESYE